MTVWFTADLHLGHGNILKYCNRPFLSPQERAKAATDPRGKWRVSADTVRRHDDELLDAINTRVRPEDRLYVLGDFCWGRYEEALAHRERIACRDVILVWGNHDHREVGRVFQHTLEQGMITVEGQDIWLCHYPLRTWNRRFHGSWSLYGHVHGKFVAEDEANLSSLTRDVGVDACDYRPLSFQDLCAYMAPRMDAFWKQKDAMLRGEADPVV